MSDRICSIEDCGKPLYAKALCGMHYQRERLGRAGRPTCSMPECTKTVYAQKLVLCRTHYNALTPDEYWRTPERSASHEAAVTKWLSVDANRLARNKRTSEWRKETPERGAADRKRWREANPERFANMKRASEAKRRAQKRATSVEAVSYPAIIERDGMVCHICLDPIASQSELHFDHVIPLSRGGAHAASNIRPAHAVCNMRKGSRVA